MDTSRGPYRRYSDAEKAQALATLRACGGNTRAASRELGIPAGTLQSWQTEALHPDVARSFEHEKVTLAGRWEKVANAALDVLDGEQGVRTLGAAQAATVGGIATDKVVLLRGDAPAAAAVVVIVAGPSLMDL